MSRALQIREEDVQLALPPRMFRALKSLCRDALSYGSNHASLRRDIVFVIAEMRALNEHGLDTPDVQELKNLLKSTDPKNADAQPEQAVSNRDPIEALIVRRRLNEDQVDAAKAIRRVWESLARGLAVKGRDYRKGGTTSTGRVLHPIDIMSEEQLQIYEFVYQPWFERQKPLFVEGKRHRRIHVVSIVFNVLLDFIHPTEIDHNFGLYERTSIKVLRTSLDEYAVFAQRAALA